MCDFNCSNCYNTNNFCQDHWYQYCDIKRRCNNFDALSELVVNLLNEYPEIEEEFKKFTRFEKKDGTYVAKPNVLDKSKYVKKNQEFDKGYPFANYEPVKQPEMTIGQIQRFVSRLLENNKKKGSSGFWKKENMVKQYPEAFEVDPDNEDEMRLCTSHIDDPNPKQLPDPAEVQHTNDAETYDFNIHYACNDCNQEYKMCHDCRALYWHMLETDYEYRRLEQVFEIVVNNYPKASLKILSFKPDIYREIKTPTVEQINHVIDVVVAKANSSPEQEHGFFDYDGSKSAAQSILKMILKYDSQDADVIKRAVEFDVRLLEHVKDISEELYQYAFKKDPRAFEFRKNPTDQEIVEAVKRNAYLMKFVPEERQSINLHMIALVYNYNQYHCIQYFKNVEPKVYAYAARLNGDALRFIKIENVTYQMIIDAFGTCSETAESALLEKKYLERGKQYTGCSFNSQTGEITSFSLKDDKDNYEDGNMEEWKQILYNFKKDNWILSKNEIKELCKGFDMLTEKELDDWEKIRESKKYSSITQNQRWKTIHDFLASCKEKKSTQEVTNDE